MKIKLRMQERQTEKSMEHDSKLKGRMNGESNISERRGKLRCTN
jgi:hypothetical protein